MDLINSIKEKFDALPVYMDYEGQRKAERLFQTIVVLFAIVGFVWGYVCQQFSQTVYIMGAGLVLSCLLALPPWPMYRTKPLKWQKPRVQSSSPSASTSTQSNAGGPSGEERPSVATRSKKNTKKDK